MNKRGLTSLAMVLLLLSGCATTTPSKLNQYTIEKSIIKGKTTKQEILNIFGAPNITTKNANYIPTIESKDTKITMPAAVTADETWSYSRSSTDANSGWTNLIPVVGLFSMSMSMKMTMLTIYFDKDDIVQDYTVTTMQ